MNTIILAAASTKMSISIAALVIPWVIVVALVCAGIIAYVKTNGLSSSTVLSISKTLFDVPEIRHWFDNQINKAITLVAVFIAEETEKNFEGSYDAVLKYVSGALLALLQTVDTTLENTLAAKEIYNVLNKYKTNVNDIERISNYIIETLGYTKDEVIDEIKDKVDNIVKED